MRKIKLGFFLFVLIYIVLFIRLWFCLNQETKEIDSIYGDNSGAFDPNEYVTFIFREFESFDNDIRFTISSLVDILTIPKILVVYDDLIYPPLKLPTSYKSMVKLLNLSPDITEKPPWSNIQEIITTPYAIFIPDSVRLLSKDAINNVIREIKHKWDVIAIHIEEEIQCANLVLNLRQWTASYRSNGPCSSIIGKHAILLSVSLLKNLLWPFQRPMPEMFYMQATTHNITVRISSQKVFKNGRQLFDTPHLKWKYEQKNDLRRTDSFTKFKIKKVESMENTEWFGCSKETPRCFGTVLNDTPDYLLLQRWTPPCCLENLRTTARHVFETLDSCDVRYWLEGGSLLGAVRTGDIIPWDYDVDIGVYQDDLIQCHIFQQLKHKDSVLDAKGYFWEKTSPSEGNFYRCHYSQVNRAHVDIFPFYPVNNTMTKDSWFIGHKQDRPFPQAFLKPLSAISFVGVRASAPNNINEFLELKFGPGVIENPEYPNPNLISYKSNNPAV